MQRFKSIFPAMALMFLCPPAQAQSESPIRTRIVQAFARKAPGWKLVVGIESCHFPVVPSEKTVLVASLYNDALGGPAQGVLVRIYEVANTADAAKWLMPTRSGSVAEGWRVQKYSAGDEGYLARFKSGKRFEIHFRSGKVVGAVAGNSLPRVKRFASIVIAATYAE